MKKLQATALQVSYGSRPVIDNLHTSFPEGKITTVIGPNGCGKSTLLKAVSRLLSPESGGVYLDGENIQHTNTKKLARKMALLPQTQKGAAGLTAWELVSYGRYPHQRAFGRLSRYDRERIAWAMGITGTTDYKDHPVDGLSGGQRQRVWIAMALAQDTELIILDEPTTYLDMAHQLEVMELLQKLNQEEGRTIVMVLHDLNQAARYSDHLIAMRSGEIVQEGPSQEVITAHTLRRVFDIEALIGKDPYTGTPMCMTYHLIKGETHNEKNTYRSIRANA
ncbi:ABC transporter ATP-binding protein [Alkalicoccus saliphilus]|jgi:iron complex transport system ATP-binding protein|uniref:Iron-enterobactin transporter ATP-binding protein n=1 Tax=Alkalicoccus saliphilus TaxID=200989 RepID=A0A2T4U4F3_9BACI|nr:ABC transporter ATP-binding protein [Alkalicoccus saliphilus]PTL38283.1 iron-enterobactin transporter ATP-binding protein [Alkalicoccus saliphilus]